MGAPKPTQAMAALLAAQEQAAKAAETYRVAEEQRAAAERDLHAIRAELLTADPNATTFAELVQKSMVAEARIGALAARARTHEAAASEANTAVNAAGPAVQREEVAALEQRARKLEAEIRQRARAFTAEAGKGFEELHAVMLEGAQRLTAIARAENGQAQGLHLAFIDVVGFTTNVVAQHVASLQRNLDAHDAEIAAKGRA